MSQPKHHAGPRRRRWSLKGIATLSALAVALSLPMAASAYAADGDVADPAVVSDVVLPQDDTTVPEVAPIPETDTPVPDSAPAPEPDPAPALEQATEPDITAPLARTMTTPIQYTYVAWQLVEGSTPTTSGSFVGGSQPYVGQNTDEAALRASLPQCGPDIQIDKYPTWAVAGLIADGKLDAGEDSSVVVWWDFVDNDACPLNYFLESSYIKDCGSVEITLRNVSPWIYPMSVEIDGVHSYGPVVDNRGAAPDDQTATRTITFPEDSGRHIVRYRVQAGTESDLYAGLPVGEWTTLTIETNCLPDVVQCEQVVDGGIVTNLDMDAWTVTNGTWTEDGLRLDSDNWVDARVTKTTSFNLSAARSLALDMDVLNTAGNYGLGIELQTSAGILHWEDVYSDEFWSYDEVLPPTLGGQGGPYSGSLEDALATIGDVEVTSVTIIFSSATPNSAILNSETSNCSTVAFEYERPPAPPTKDPTFTEWSHGEWVCGDTTVDQTRTRTDYAASVWDPETKVWVEDTVGTPTIETRTRDLKADEIKKWQTADPEAACYNRPEPPNPEKGSRTVVTCTSATDYIWDINPVWNESTGKYDMVKGPETASSPRTPTATELKDLTCPTPPPPPTTCPSGTTWTDSNHDGKVTTDECKNTPPAAATDWSNHAGLTSQSWMVMWATFAIALMLFVALRMIKFIPSFRRRGVL